MIRAGFEKLIFQTVRSTKLFRFSTNRGALLVAILASVLFAPPANAARHPLNPLNEQAVVGFKSLLGSDQSSTTLRGETDKFDQNGRPFRCAVRFSAQGPQAGGNAARERLFAKVIAAGDKPMEMDLSTSKVTVVHDTRGETEQRDNTLQIAAEMPRVRRDSPKETRILTVHFDERDTKAIRRVQMVTVRGFLYQTTERIQCWVRP